MRHDSVRDLFASLARDVFTDVVTEPHLQPIPEDMGVSSEKARADFSIRGLSYRGVNTYFDVRIVNTMASSYEGVDVEHVLQLHEDRKKDKYLHRILNFDYGTFTPLVFAASGARGKEAEDFMKHLASKISRKKKEQYCKVAALLSIRLSFAIQRAAILCIRGAHIKCPYKSHAVYGGEKR